MDKKKSKMATSKLSAFFENDDDETSFPQRTVDDAKLSQYAAGKVRKSRREKEQEAAEVKKREEEENAAKAYAEFLDAFEGDDRGKKKSGSSFVKASTESKAAYTPALKLIPEAAAPRMFNTSPSPPSASILRPKGKRAMDTFLEEIKKQRPGRKGSKVLSSRGRASKIYFPAHGHGRSVTALAAYEGQSGSKDRGDPETSNVFVANLPSRVTEQSLGHFFARIGPVGSVKIMWPRFDGTAGPGAEMTTSRRTKNLGLSGFVSFMKRKDAEAALRELDGFDWGGSVLRVGWSKAVPVAARPKYTSGESKAYNGDSSDPSRSRSRSRSITRRRSRSPPRYRHYRSSNRSYSPSSRSRDRSNNRRRSYSRSHRRDRSDSRSPWRRSCSPYNRGNEEEAVTDTFIRAVAAEIRGHGFKYEEKLREREQGNPKYAFLTNKGHRRHAYFRNLIQSDWSVDPEFDDEGYNSVYSTDSAEESEHERVRKGCLGRLARKRFEAMLRALSGKRGELARCMAFSLEHAEAAHEVSDIIVASLLVEGTPVPRKVTRLYLICDILHNSAASAPGAWKFRQEFQSRMGIVFDHLANIYHSFPGRITAETFKKQITAVVDIWEDWIVFPPEFTYELRMRLEGTAIETQSKPENIVSDIQETTDVYASRFKPSSFQLATFPMDRSVSRNSDSGEPMDVNSGDDRRVNNHVEDPTENNVGSLPLKNNVDGDPISDDIDGIPIGEDIDGIPIGEDIDGIPISEDIDGIPIGEDIDGIPSTDDIDGTPMDDEFDSIPVNDGADDTVMNIVIDRLHTGDEVNCPSTREAEVPAGGGHAPVIGDRTIEEVLQR